MPKKELVSLLVILVWVATFTPIGSSVYNPTESEVQQLGGEKSPLDEPPDPVPQPDDES
jgi:hypothetical protein